MKQKIFFGIFLLLLLASCGKQPTYTDNGNPGAIKAVVFYDDNMNGVMDSSETGAPQRVAISQEVTCTPANPEYVSTDADGEVLFKDLRPGRYCVWVDNGYGMTTKMNMEVYLSSDQELLVKFGLVRP